MTKKKSKLDPLASTLPGDPGVPFSKKKREGVTGPSMNSLGGMHSTVGAWEDFRKAVLGVGVTAEEIRDEERRQHELDLRRKREEAENRKAFAVIHEKHQSVLSMAKDSTLVKVIEFHAPSEYKEGRQWITSWAGNGFVSPTCTGCNHSGWPCKTMQLIIPDLDRRQATDPFLEETGVKPLMDGAL